MEKGLKSFDKYIKTEDLIGSAILIEEEDVKNDTPIKK